MHSRNVSDSILPQLMPITRAVSFDNHLMNFIILKSFAAFVRIVNDILAHLQTDRIISGCKFLIKLVAVTHKTKCNDASQ
jgi:hypothetical protein